MRNQARCAILPVLREDVPRARAAGVKAAAPEPSLEDLQICRNPDRVGDSLRLRLPIFARLDDLARRDPAAWAKRTAHAAGPCARKREGKHMAEDAPHSGR